MLTSRLFQNEKTDWVRVDTLILQYTFETDLGEAMRVGMKNLLK